MQESICFKLLNDLFEHVCYRFVVRTRDKNINVAAGWPASAVGPTSFALDIFAPELHSGLANCAGDLCGHRSRDSLLEIFEVLEANLLVCRQDTLFHPELVNRPNTSLV